jgi:hypothetical protein
MNLCSWVMKKLIDHWNLSENIVKKECGTEATLYLFFLKLSCLFFFLSNNFLLFNFEFSVDHQLLLPSSTLLF